MKKRIGILLLTALVAVSAFALVACGGLSGSEIAEQDYTDMMVNHSGAFTSGSVKMEATLNLKTEEEVIKTEDFTSSTSNYSTRSYKKTTTTTTNESSAKVKIVTEETKAYLLIEGSSKETEKTTYEVTDSTYITNESTSSTNKSTSGKSKMEYYIEIADGKANTILKDENGKWVLIDSTAVKDDYTIEDAVSGMLNLYASFRAYKFEDYEYKSGRYVVKQSVIDAERELSEGKNDNTTKYTYTYNKDDRYIVFNKDKLYSGYVNDYDAVKVIETYAENTNTTAARTTKDIKSIKTTEKNINKSQAAYTYGKDSVNIPSYTK